MGEESPPRVPLRATRRGQNIIVASSVAATVVFLGAAVGAFFVGQSLAPQTSTGNVTQVQEVLEVERPVAEFPSLTGGPREPGDASWVDLRGGECLRPFETAFAETFSVVECSTPHDAQVLVAQLVSRDRTEVYPGEAAMALRAREICDVSELVNTEYAAEFENLYIEPSYPVTQDQWDEGQRVVWCFVRSGSGEVFEQSFLD